MGVSTDKTLAKYPAKYKKPLGITVFSPSDVPNILQGLPVGALCGIGLNCAVFSKFWGAYV